MGLFIKICGITRLEDALAALEAGADALGFVSHPPSPRHIEPEEIAGIIAETARGIPRKTFKAVGVFVNPTKDSLETHLAAGIDVIQLHGDETAEFALQAAETASDVEVWKALRPRTPEDSAQYVGFPADKFLIDAFHGKIRGGTGIKLDAETAAAAITVLDKPVILAGGLTPENVFETARTLHPFGLDVSGGVEASPGIKDHARLKRFIRAVRGDV